jgi:hypothetical protein
MRRHRYVLQLILPAMACACQAASSTPSTAPERGAAATPAAATPSAFAVSAPAASTETPAKPSKTMHSFVEDVEFLTRHGAVKVLRSPSGGRVAISGKYQARVMTSAVTAEGASLGFVNRAFIEAGKTGTAFDNYGGEDRFWLGPEGSRFALYFAPGKALEFANWQTPSAFQEGEWTALDGATDLSVTFVKRLSLTNYAKTPLELEVRRKLSVLTSEQARAALGLSIPDELAWVGFESDNTLINQGQSALREATGLPSVWILGMFMPATDTRVIVPFEKAASGEIVNDRYFGKVSPERLHVDPAKGLALFKCDGQLRSKIGLGQARAKDVLGSYSAQSGLLTIVRFTRPHGTKRYVNNAWELAAPPYEGDVSNAYNDGPIEPGQPSLGGFYELESSSPAAALAPKASLQHVHQTYHFSGSRPALEAIALKVLGVSLNDVEQALQ